MKCELKTLILVLLIFDVDTVEGAAPTCSPSTYTISAGINSTVNEIFTSITCTDADADNLTYAVDATSDGYSYFTMDGNQLKLVNRLDVEFGINSWTILVIVTDTSSGTDTATVTVNTYTSTTTTTTTPPPPGYDWFESSDNKILFGSAMGFAAILTGTCIMLCFRFRKKGTCFPKRCPEFRQCTASFGRQVTCCPLPCDFYGKNKKPEPDGDQEEELVYEDTFPGPTATTSLSPQKKTKAPDKKETQKSETPASAKSLPVSPVVIGNVNLDDVGFDGMRSPGFNAPMFTSYGGNKGRVLRINNRKY